MVLVNENQKRFLYKKYFSDHLEQHRKHIEQHSTTLERTGMSPVAARIFTYLLFEGKEGAVFEDMVSYFKVSKSAVSNALKMLTMSGMVAYRTVGGKRKRYFYIDIRKLFNEREVLDKYTQFFGILEDVRKTRNKPDEFDKELGDISILYQMLVIEFPLILERWHRKIVGDL